MKSAPRLFHQFQPDNYQLAIHLDKDNLTFSGRVIIVGKKVGRPSQRLTFHQAGLKISSASIIKHDKKEAIELAIARLNNHNSSQEVRLHTSQMIYPGVYTVTIDFSGKISQEMTGIYPCFIEHKGKQEVIIATQFESHFARKAFPCIDEPEAKSTFDVSVSHASSDVILGNMPLKSQERTNGQTTSHFETTPKMSTYLLAFVAGNLHCAEGQTKAGVAVRSWAHQARPRGELQYSVDEAVKVLDFFTEYFGVAYPLKKCDQVALPDFDAGAMENWGLITYREIALLADPDNRSISNEQYVSLVVAHELSHQWFGNLVTMKWWDDLWLNESFASVMEHLALDAIHPDWKQWELYTSTDVISSTSRDIYKDIQPVGVPVTDPDLLDTVFDPGIVYAKGAHLLKMLREYIGDKAFRQGLQQYFKDHAYGSTTRDDLWRALGKASSKDLVALMNPWITQAGMPLVHVKQQGKSLVLTQERYVLDTDHDQTVWPIPLLADQTLTPDIFSTRTALVEADTATPVVLNSHASGHFLTHYQSIKQRRFLGQQLQTQALSTEARINVLNDMIMLARRGDAPLTDPLDLIAHCTAEPRDAVWGLIARVVGTASLLTEGNKTADTLLKKLRRQLANQQFDHLGWDDQPQDDSNTKQLRHTMLALMISGENQSVIQQALERFGAVSELSQLAAELRNTILGTAVRHGSPKNVDVLLAAYPKSGPDVQLDITSALASTKKAAVAEKILHTAVGPEGFVRPQDLMRWLALFMRNHYTREVMWDKMTAEWPWFESIFTTSKSFDYLPTYCASVITTPEWEQRYHTFFKPLEANKILVKNITIGYADIASRVAWRQRDELKIIDWLKTNVH
jgi:aminopeptidase N